MTAGDTALVSVQSHLVGRDRLWLLTLLAVFVITGASGLIYQVVWVRMLALVFGVTAYAISTVLSSFFAGLALGSFLSGRISDRLRSPLRAYAAAEILVAAFGLLTPAAFALARLLYLAIHDALPDSLAALTLVRFVLAFGLLLLPTTLMGATLPLVVRAGAQRTERIARNLSLLYAANTFGAMAGAYAAGFELIGRYGLRGSLLIAAAGNVIAALAALALAGRSPAPGPPATDPTTQESGNVDVSRPLTPPPHVGEGGRGTRSATVALVVFGVSGAVSLAYEVVWARLLAMFFDASTYGFTAMLTMVLFGIGLGSWLISPVIGRRWNWMLVFAAIEAAVGLLGLLALPLLTHLIPLAERLGLYTDPGALGQFSVRFMAFAAFLVVAPPMLLLGASFPVAARVVGVEGGVGRRIGGVYAVNVFGGIIGALAGGFLLVPYLGARASLLLLACVNLALAVALVWGAVGKLRPVVAPGLAAFAIAVIGIITAPDLLTGIFRDRFAGQDVIWVDEGLENTVAITDSRTTDERKMYINGQPQATTFAAVTNFHKLIGHLPVLLHADPRRALVIGLGGGATGGALAAHSGVEVDLVELSSAVVGAAPLFASVNGDVLERPNVALHVDDGRNFLLVTDQRYDVITADIIRPNHAGAGNLYSREYYQLARERLAEGGIMLQWLEQLSEEQYRLLMRSFVEVFPYVTLWANGSLLAGSNQPLSLDRATLAQRLADPPARASLAAIGLNTPDDVLNLYTGNRAEALRYVAGERRMVSDNHPYVEFHRTLNDSRRPPDLSGFSRDIRQVLGGP